MPHCWPVRERWEVPRSAEILTTSDSSTAAHSMSRDRERDRERDLERDLERDGEREGERAGDAAALSRPSFSLFSLPPLPPLSLSRSRGLPLGLRLRGDLRGCHKRARDIGHAGQGWRVVSSVTFDLLCSGRSLSLHYALPIGVK